MYALILSILITAQPVYTHEVVIDGNIYAYTSTANADDYIVTVNGEVIYIADLITAEEVKL